MLLEDVDVPADSRTVSIDERSEWLMLDFRTPEQTAIPGGK